MEDLDLIILISVAITVILIMIVLLIYLVRTIRNRRNRRRQRKHNRNTTLAKSANDKRTALNRDPSSTNINPSSSSTHNANLIDNGGVLKASTSFSKRPSISQMQHSNNSTSFLKRESIQPSSGTLNLSNSASFGKRSSVQQGNTNNDGSQGTLLAEPFTLNPMDANDYDLMRKSKDNMLNNEDIVKEMIITKLLKKETTTKSPKTDSSSYVRTTTTDSTTLSAKQGILAIPGFLEMEKGKDFEVLTEHRLGKGKSCNVFAASIPASTSKLIVAKVATINDLLAVKSFLAEEGRELDFHFEVAIMYWLGNDENVINMLGFCIDPLSILMPYCQTSLAHVISLARTKPIGDPDAGKQKNMIRLTKENIYKISLQVSKGMAHIHKKKIIHLDLKPGNILIQIKGPTDFICKISDFGFASPLHSNDELRLVSGLKRPESMGYTITYAAPELLNRSPLLSRPNMEINLKMDVYSYGITLYELVFQKHPWHGLSELEIKEKVRANARPEVKSNNFMQMPETTNTINNSILSGNRENKIFLLMEHCWHSNPEQRPSFQDIYQDLSDQ